MDAIDQEIKAKRGCCHGDCKIERGSPSERRPLFNMDSLMALGMDVSEELLELRYLRGFLGLSWTTCEPVRGVESERCLRSGG